MLTTAWLVALVISTVGKSSVIYNVVVTYSKSITKNYKNDDIIQDTSLITISLYSSETIQCVLLGWQSTHLY